MIAGLAGFLRAAHNVRKRELSCGERLAAYLSETAAEPTERKAPIQVDVRHLLATQLSGRTGPSPALEPGLRSGQSLGRGLE